MAADAATGLLASNPYLAGGSMLMDAMQGGSSSASGTSTSSFDASGWNVNFGSGTIESKRSSGQPVSTASGEDLAQFMPYIVGVVGLLVVYRLMRKKKGG